MGYTAQYAECLTGDSARVVVISLLEQGSLHLRGYYALRPLRHVPGGTLSHQSGDGAHELRREHGADERLAVQAEGRAKGGVHLAALASVRTVVGGGEGHPLRRRLHRRGRRKGLGWLREPKQGRLGCPLRRPLRHPLGRLPGRLLPPALGRLLHGEDGGRRAQQDSSALRGRSK